MFLLDTNACIHILNGSSKTLVDNLHAHDPSAIRLCSVVKAELLYGARNSSHVADNLQLLQRFFKPFLTLISHRLS